MPSSFANSDHTHSDYLPLSGGSLTWNLNIGGILRVNNQQSVYDSGTMITLYWREDVQLHRKRHSLCWRDCTGYAEQ